MSDASDDIEELLRAAEAADVRQRRVRHYRQPKR